MKISRPIINIISSWRYVILWYAFKKTLTHHILSFFLLLFNFKAKTGKEIKTRSEIFFTNRSLLKEIKIWLVYKGLKPTERHLKELIRVCVTVMDWSMSGCIFPKFIHSSNLCFDPIYAQLSYRWENIFCSVQEIAPCEIQLMAETTSYCGSGSMASYVQYLTF